MRNSQVKVLYTASNPRSGSTIVHRVLGQIDGFVSVGELRDIWQYGLFVQKPELTVKSLLSFVQEKSTHFPF